MSIDDQVMLMRMAREIFTDEELDYIKNELGIKTGLDDILADEGDDCD